MDRTGRATRRWRLGNRRQRSSTADRAFRARRYQTLAKSCWRCEICRGSPRIRNGKREGKRSEEQTYELQSLTSNTYAAFRLKKQNKKQQIHKNSHKQE